MDIASREAIEEALDDYRGTILVISHDRYFLEKITNRVVLIEDKTLKDFPMGIGDFLIDSNWLNKSKGKVKTRHKERKKKQEKTGSVLEEKIEALEKDKMHIEKKIEEAFNKGRTRIASDLKSKLKKLSKTLDSLYEEYIDQ